MCTLALERPLHQICAHLTGASSKPGVAAVVLGVRETLAHTDLRDMVTSNPRCLPFRRIAELSASNMMAHQ